MQLEDDDFRNSYPTPEPKMRLLIEDKHWFSFPNLQIFTLISVTTKSKSYTNLMIQNFLVSNPQLTVVCIVCIDANGLLPYVSKLHNPTSLSLSSGNQVQTGIACSLKHLSKLNNLRHLDLSSATHCTYPNEAVANFLDYVASAPKLTSLELAGTNLSMIVGHEKQCLRNLEFSKDDCFENCMVPLENRRFTYLGLVNCPSKPYMHRYLPADKAMLAFLDRYQDWNDDPLEDFEPLLLTLMDCLLVLYYLIEDKFETEEVTMTQRRKLLERMLVLIDNCTRWFRKSREKHSGLKQVLKLSLLILAVLPNPEDAIYCYMVEKYIITLVGVAESVNNLSMKELSLQLLYNTCLHSQDFNSRIGGEFRLLKTLTIYMAGWIEFYVGEEKFFKTAWNVLVTLTDEVPSNCQLFLENDGVELAMKFIKLYPKEYKIHRSIAGTLANVSEHPDLRPVLYQEELVLQMRNFLEYVPEVNDNNVKNCIAAASNAATFLVMLTADGPEVWTIPSQSRDKIMEAVENAIDTWHIDTRRGQVYSFLNPMLRYMENSDSPTAQYWACWKICNLLTCSPSEYNSMFKLEGGMEIIHRLKLQPELRSKVKRLVDTIAEIMEKS